LPKSEAERMKLADEKLDEMDKHSEKKRVAAVNIFEKADVVAGAEKVYKVDVPSLGGFVTFKKLTWLEARELGKISDIQERSIKTIAKMIQKANPHLNIEESLKTMSLDDIGTISKLIMTAEAFLLQKKPAP
jgi:hypothetical protein